MKDHQGTILKLLEKFRTNHRDALSSGGKHLLAEIIDAVKEPPWQDMDSAPTDQLTEILVASKLGKVRLARRYRDRWEMVGGDFPLKPVKWMPVPEVPHGG